MTDIASALKKLGESVAVLQQEYLDICKKYELIELNTCPEPTVVNAVIGAVATICTLYALKRILL